MIGRNQSKHVFLQPAFLLPFGQRLAKESTAAQARKVNNHPSHHQHCSKPVKIESKLAAGMFSVSTTKVLQLKMGGFCFSNRAPSILVARTKSEEASLGAEQLIMNCPSNYFSVRRQRPVPPMYVRAHYTSKQFTTFVRISVCTGRCQRECPV